MKNSIRMKLSVFLAALLIFTVFLLSALILGGIRKNQREDYEKYMKEQAKVANTYMNQIYMEGDVADKRIFLEENADYILRELSSINSIYAGIYDMDKNVVSSNVSYADAKDLLDHAAKGKIAYKLNYDHVEYMAPLYHEDQIGVMHIRYSLKRDMEFYDRMKKMCINIGSAVFILSFALAYSYFSRMTKDIALVQMSTQSIKNGRFDEVSKLERSDELGRLSEDVSFMGRRIEENMQEMEKKQANLEYTVEKLREVESRQKRFIGNITHQFKTPLTIIRTHMDLISMYPDDKGLVEDAGESISHEAERLSEMVEKTLKLSSMQSYDFEFESRPVRLDRVLGAIVERMRAKAQKFEISMASQLEECQILADAENLTHIFMNIIDNAIKYNESGGRIWVRMRKNSGRVVVEIGDSGIGISKEDRKKVFEPFYTLNRQASKTGGGTGLGLSLVKSLVERQRGKIRIEGSGYMEGMTTVFVVSFPLLEK